MRFVINLFQSIPALLLAIAILFLAGPRELSIPKQKRSLSNIEFCLDVSGSMTAQFGDGSRYDGAMTAINEFIDYREGDAFGLSIFSNRILQWVPLTNDTSAFKCATPFLRPENLPPQMGGGTEIGKALLHCLDVLIERETGDRMVILVSDGYSADLSGGNEEKIANQFWEAGVSEILIEHEFDFFVTA